MQPIRIVLVDDHQIFRDGVRLLLEKETDLSICGETASGLEALQLVRELRPDILLLDISLRGVNGLEILQQIGTASPGTRTIIVTQHENVAYVRNVFEQGARGYVIKDSCSSELISAIRSVHAGQVHFSPRVEQNILGSLVARATVHDPEDASFATLTQRELEVFRLIVEGLSTQQIADFLCISPKTIDKHRASITRKTGLDNPARMVHFAIRLGLVDPKIWQG